MAMPKTFAHRCLQFAKCGFNRLPCMGEINLQRSTRLGADQILIALRTCAREVPTIDLKSAVGAVHGMGEMLKSEIFMLYI